MVLVDSNVLIDVMTHDVVWCDWSLAQLRANKALDKLTINPMIYAELAVAYASVAELDSFLKPAGLIVSPISNQTAFLPAVPSCVTARPKAPKLACCQIFSLARRRKRRAGRYSHATQHATGGTFQTSL